LLIGRPSSYAMSDIDGMPIAAVTNPIRRKAKTASVPADGRSWK
jgi:hypothetical protein